jgi:hypothetical protein
MAYEKEAVQYIEKWFQRDTEHLVNVVAGPRREAWFNAEAYVALSHRARYKTFVMWGEQEWQTVVGRSVAAAFKELKEKKPDLIGFDGKEGPEAIQFVIESKVIYNGDGTTAVNKTLEDLRRQLLRSMSVTPRASAIGVLYLVWQGGQGTPTKKPRKGDEHNPEPELVFKPKPVEMAKLIPSNFYQRVVKQTGTIFSGLKYQWLRTPSPLGGRGWKSPKTSFKYRYTSFHYYPNIPTSVGLGALALRGL